MVFISFEVIKKVVMFDLQQAWSALGKKILLQQTVGIPIGGVMSATLARLMVSNCERIAIQKFPLLKVLVKAGRYTDDLRAYALATSEEAGNKLLDTMAQSIYDGGLKVKPDPQESIFSWVGFSGNGPDFWCANKNAQRMLQGKVQNSQGSQNPPRMCQRQHASVLSQES